MATSVPIGYGHSYAPDDYIDAWIAVTDPPNWSGEAITQLKKLFLRCPSYIVNQPVSH